MRILKLKATSFFATLALFAVLFGAAQAQDVPPPPTQQTAGTTTSETEEEVGRRPERPEKMILPTLQVLSGDMKTWTNKPEDGFNFVGFVLSNTNYTFSSSYGNITSGAVRKMTVCFSNSTRAENGQIIIRIGTAQGIVFPFSVKLVRDGFVVTDLGPNVKLKNKLTGEPYQKGSKILYLLPGLNFSSFVEVNFQEEFNPLQVLIEIGDNKTDLAINFLGVNDPNPQPRPAPPTRP